MVKNNLREGGDAGVLTEPWKVSVFGSVLISDDMQQKAYPALLTRLWKAKMPIA